MRSPRHEMVRGIQNALASLHQASDLQFSRWSVPTGCSADSEPAPQDTDSESSSNATPTSKPVREVNSGNKSRQHTKKSHPQGRRSASGPSTTTVVRDRKHKLRNRYLACPFQKEDLIHDRHATCKYPGAHSMSALRTHLAGRQHRGTLPFIDLCSSCKEYVISESAWKSLHIHGLCRSGGDKPKVQIRNSPSNNSRIGAQWLRLFVNIFPASQRLPSPCRSRLPTSSHSLTR
jgi:hypothetical protein